MIEAVTATKNYTFMKLCMCICALHRSSCDEISIVNVVLENSCFCLISFSSGGVLAATSENDTMSVTFNDATVSYSHTFC